MAGGKKSTLNPGDPVFNGSSGPDSFSAPAGSSGINGFGGTDTVTFSFNLVDATVSYSGNTVFIDTASSHTELTGIQTYVFADGTVNEKDGNALVADLFYYSKYHDIWNAHIEADTHYMLYGWHEGRDPSAFFDTNLYLALNQDVRASGANPLDQFHSIGWTQNRQPSATFSVQKYLAAYPDVAAAHVDPLEHFLSNGIDEGRVPFPVTSIVNSVGFDALYYLQTYGDVKAARVDPYQHYLTSGWHEGRNPNAYFDTRGYLATYTDVAAAGVNPLIHFDQYGWHEGRISSPGFDPAQYLAAYGDVAAAGVDPLKHYLEYGIDEGRVAFAKPVFDTNGAANTVLEGAAAGTNTGLSVSWGGWVSPNLSFSIGSDSSGGAFTINNLTGAVTVADSSKLDFETSGASHSYTIVVVAHDIGLSASQAFTIVIGDVPPPTPVDANGAANVVAEGATNGTGVGITLFSNEPNGPPVTYSLTNDAGGRFTIDGSTGVVTVANAALIDFEGSAPSHQFTITARAASGSVTTATQDFTITVTDVAPSVPTDANGAANSVAEGAANGTLVGIVASSTDPNGPAPSYSLTDDASGRFTINSSSGAVSVANGAAVDFEAAHAYSITVRATVGALSSSQSFSISVTDVNDTAPVFTSSSSPSLAENTTSVVSLATTDADTVGTNPPVFSVSGGADAAKFQIAGDGHTLEFKIAPDFDVPGSAAASNVYAVNVSAFDGVNTTVQSLSVAVTDVNDNAPVFGPGTTGGEVENTSTGNVVFDANATDADGTAANNTIAYSLSSGGDNDLFLVDSSTGFVTFKPFPSLPPDFENPTDADHNNTYLITVHANDGVNDVTQNVTITITDANDNAPVFQFPLTSTTPPFTASSTAENAAYSFDAHATDADATAPNNTITYSLTGPDAGALSISAAGIVTFNTTPDFEAFADANGDNVFEVTVHAIDNGVHDVARDMRITVTDTNDNAPVFTSGATGGGAENALASTIVYTATATDADATPSFKVIQFSLQSGIGDNNLFNIDSATGEVRFSSSPDYEGSHAPTYNIVITASDGVSSPTKAVTINVTDVNDNAPIFDVADTTDSKPEEAVYSFNGHATDLDGTAPNNQIAYSLTGEDAADFAIDSAGVVTYVGLPGGAPDYETPTDLNIDNVYKITIHAKDGNGAGPNDTTRDLEITITDQSDVPPVFTSGTTGSEAEGTAISNVVYTAATVPSGVTFSLTGTDAGEFDINPTTGEVTFKVAPNFETPTDADNNNSYLIVVNADDGNNPVVLQPVTITVTDVAPVIDPVDGNAAADSVNEGALEGADAGIKVVASDFGADTVNFTLTNSAGDRFKIDPDGTVRAGANASLINYETSGVTHSYTITVQASTSGGTATSSKVYTILVGNVAPTGLTDSDGSINRIATLAANGTPVGITYFASDPNGGPLTYTLTNDDSGNFVIDATTGVVTLSSTHGALGPVGTVHTIAATASDGLATTGAVSFNIVVANDVPTIDLNGPTAGLGFSDTFTEISGGSGPIAIAASNISITDPAATQLVSATITLTNAQVGDTLTLAPAVLVGLGISQSTVVDAGTITIKLTGASLLANYETAIKNIKFDSTSQNPNTTARLINVVGNDGTNDSNIALATIAVVAVNDAPVIANTPTSFLFTENGALQPLFAGVAVTDADSPVNFSGGTLTLSSPDANDQIVLQSATFSIGGSVGAGVFNLLRSGVLIGTITDPGTNSVSIALNSAATLSIVNELAQAFGFQTSETSVSGVRNITLQFNDGGHTGTGPGLSNAMLQQATVTSVNDAPVNTVPATIAVTEDIASPLTGISFADVDAGTNTVLVTLSVPSGALAATTGGGVTVGGTPSALTLSGSIANINAFIAASGVTFTTALNATANVTLTVLISDNGNSGGGGAQTDTDPVTLTVNAVNDVPVLASNASPTVTFTENGVTVAPLTNGTVTDADLPANFAGGGFTVAITGGSLQAGDQIVVLGGTGFTVSGSSLILGSTTIGTIAFGSGSATVTNLTTAATPTVVDALVKAFGFQNSSENPSTTPRTINFTFNDGGNTGIGPGVSNTLSQTVNVIAVNDAPVNHVPSGTPGIGTGGTFTFNGANTISITDVDGGANEKVTLSVTSGTLSLSGTTGLSFSVGDGLTDATMTFTGTVAAINTALNGLVYNAGLAGSQTLTITTDDQGNTGTGGTLTDTDAVTINVSTSGLTGQLWYVTRDGTTAGDNVVGHINSDIAGVVHFSVGAETQNDIAIDTSAGYYFVLDSLQNLTPYLTGGHVPGTPLVIGTVGDTVDAIALDPVYATIFVSVVGTTAATTGIKEISYNPSTGVLIDTGNFLINGVTVPTFFQAIDITVDVANRLLYYVDSNATDSNGIYVVDYDNGSNPANTGDASPPTATSLVQFALDGSEGFIESVAVDNRNTVTTADDIIYFLTNDVLATVPGTASLWYHSGATTALVGGVPTLAGVSTHTGLTFDPVAHQLYISNQDAAGNTDSIIQVQLDVAGTGATGSNEFDLTLLTGQATPDSTTIPGQTAFDTLPVATVHNTSFTEGTPVLVDPALTIADPDIFLASVTVTITGGFAGDGDTLSFDTTGTAIVGPVSPVLADGNGNITLTLAGRASLADYMSVLTNTLTFNSGNNPTNFGNNATRIVTWHFNDGAVGDPSSTGNTKTSTITITGVNNAPALDLDLSGASTGFTTAYTENGPAVAIADTDVTITDADNTTLVSATIVIDATGRAPDDLLSINGPLPFGITASAYVPGTGTLTLTSATANTLAEYQTALRQVVFSNLGDNPGTARTIHVKVNDGTADSNIADTTINVTPANDAPVVDLLAAAGVQTTGVTATFNETSPVVTPVFIAPNVTLSDDGPNLTQVVLTHTNFQTDDILKVSGSNASPQDIGNIHFVINNGAHTVTLTPTGATATVAEFQAALRLVQFDNDGDNPNTTPRTFTIVANDGALTGAATATVNFTATNDAPALDLNGTTIAPNAGLDYAANYTVSTAAIPVVDVDVLITDVDNSNLQSATVVLTKVAGHAGDTLTVQGALPGGITSSVTENLTTITVTLTGVASLANYQTALRQVVFANITDPDTVNDSARSIAVSVVDEGNVASIARTTTLTVFHNTAPTAVAESLAATEKGGTNNSTGGANPAPGNVITGSDSDVETPTALSVVSFGKGLVGAPTATDDGVFGTPFHGLYGVLTLNADGSYTYVLDNSNTTVQQLRAASPLLDDQYHYTITDAGGLQTSANFVVHITGAEDLPAPVNDLGIMNEESAPTNFLVRANDGLDPDTGAANTITIGPAGITVTSSASNLTTPFLNTDAQAVIVAPGGIQQVQVTLTNAAFQQLKAGETATVTVPYSLAGNGAETATANLVVTVNGVTDLPVARDDHPAAITEDANLAARTFAVLTDLDGGGSDIADTLDADHADTGSTTHNKIVIGAVTILPSTPSGLGIDVGDVGVATDAGNTQIIVTLGADFQKLQVGQTAAVDIHYTLQGNAGELSGADLHLLIGGVNDAPVVVAGATGSFTENAVSPSLVLPNLTLSDIDNANLGKVTVELTNIQTGDVLLVNGDLDNGVLANGVAYNFLTPSKIEFTGGDDIGEYQSAVREVQFTNPLDNLSNTARSFTITADDGQPLTPTGSANASFTVIAVNDAPVNTVPTPPPSPGHFYANSNTATTVAGFQIADVDANPNDVQVTLSTNQGGGITVATGLAGGLAAGDVTGNGTASVVLTGTVAEINIALANAGTGITYQSSAAFNGLNATPANNIETLTITTNDLGHNPSGALTDQDSIQIGVLPKVWYIDNSPPGSPTGPLGSINNPFTTLTAFNTVNDGIGNHPAAGDTVFLRSGTYNEAGITLLNNQKLIGEGDALTFQDPFASAGTNITVVPAGTRPIIQVDGTEIGIDLASGNNVHGLDIQTNATGAVGIDDGALNNSVGNLSITNMQITGTGKAVDIDHGGALSVTLDKLTSTGSSSEGVDLGGNVTGTFIVNNNTSAISGAAGTDFNISTNGLLNVTYTGGITQANNAAMVSISGGHTGTVTFQNGTLNATNGSGLQFTDADGTYNFGKTGDTSTLTLNGGNAGIDILAGSSGTFNFGTNSSITSPTGTAFNLLNNNATVTYSGNITANQGRAVSIDTHTGNTITFDTGNITGSGASASGILVQNNTAGIVNFNNPTITLSTQGNNAVTLLNNAGGTVNFDSGGAVGTLGLDITTTSGTGFSANGAVASIVNVKNYDGATLSNTINSTNGTALNITNTTIGANGVTFRSISSGNNDAGADPVSGIVLNNTGTSGHLTVTGDGTAANNGSGGTIQHTTGDGISLTSTQDVNLSQMNITSNLGDGIGGSTINGLVFKRLNISLNGNDAATDESGINISELTGSASNGAHATSISNSVISNNNEFELQITNSSGTLTNFQLIGNTISSNGAPINGLGSSPHGNLVNFLGHGTAIMGLTVTGGSFTGNWNAASPPATITGTGVHADTDASAAGIELTVNVTGAAFTNNNAGVNVSSGNANTDIVFDIENSSFTGQRSTAINIFENGNSPFVRTMNGTIQGNTIGTNGTAASGSLLGRGIDIGNEGAANMTLLINNNTLQSFGTGPGSGVEALAVNLGLGGQATGGGTTNLTITNNIIRDVLNSRGMIIQDNQDPGFGPFPTIFANVAGNTFTGTIAGQAGNGQFMRIRELSGTVKVTQAAPTAGAVAGELDDANGGNNSTKFNISGGVAFSQGTPPLPTTNPLPQLAAPGGVQSASATQGEMHLTQAQLDGMVAAAMTYWAAAGVSAAQLAALHNVTYDVADIIPGWLGASTPGHVTIDVDASGYGWFVDATPLDSAEFGHALSATRLQTDPAQAPAGHMDLLTTVMHEMGEQLGLQDQFAPADRGNLMSAYLATGERLLPGAADAEALAPVQQTVGKGHAVSGTAGADTFVFDQSVLSGAGAAAGAPVSAGGPAPAAGGPTAVAHIAGYSAAQGDSFDFSGLQVADAAKVRVVEDASDAFAALQIDTGGASAAHWTTVAQLDGVHAHDAIDVWLNPAHVIHLQSTVLG